ncbi:chemotaxis protein CheW [Teredinibacter purpureus]|uniref:chemotaxis protein CheW n=1 Tax=Teredinibacter purpureus TaxID=2731756 RepID=UPI0005F88F9B|nr:chemotaxis protein CheW [Teredinibacter purpureus]
MNNRHTEESLLDYFNELLSEKVESARPATAEAEKPEQVTSPCTLTTDKATVTAVSQTSQNTAPPLAASRASTSQRIAISPKPSPAVLPVTPRVERVRERAKAVTQVQVSPKKESVREVDGQHLAELEALKRQQLQALLAKQIPDIHVEQQVDLPIVDSPAAPLKESEPVEIAVECEEALSDDEKAEISLRKSLGMQSVSEVVSFSQEDLYAQSINSVLEWADNGRPQWAQNRFDVLLFDVAGLTLAVPLIALGQIQPIAEELTPIFGQSDWFMGLLTTPHGQIRTVNTALFVMPEKYSDCFLSSAKYVVSIDGLPWGLAVDSVNQPISLDPDEVKWRAHRSGRPWLAGTVKSAMCALIDIPQMGAMLQASENK